MILSTGGNIVGGHAPFYVKHTNLNSYVHFLVYRNSLTIVHNCYHYNCILYGGTAPVVARVRGHAVAPIAPVLPPPMLCPRARALHGLELPT